MMSLAASHMTKSITDSSDDTIKNFISGDTQNNKTYNKENALELALKELDKQLALLKNQSNKNKTQFSLNSTVDSAVSAIEDKHKEEEMAIAFKLIRETMMKFVTETINHLNAESIQAAKKEDYFSKIATEYILNQFKFFEGYLEEFNTLRVSIFFNISLQIMSKIDKEKMVEESSKLMHHFITPNMKLIIDLTDAIANNPNKYEIYTLFWKLKWHFDKSKSEMDNVMDTFPTTIKQQLTLKMNKLIKLFQKILNKLEEYFLKHDSYVKFVELFSLSNKKIQNELSEQEFQLANQRYLKMIHDCYNKLKKELLETTSTYSQNMNVKDNISMGMCLSDLTKNVTEFLQDTANLTSNLKTFAKCDVFYNKLKLDFRARFETAKMLYTIYTKLKLRFNKKQTTQSLTFSSQDFTAELPVAEFMRKSKQQLKLEADERIKKAQQEAEFIKKKQEELNKQMKETVSAKEKEIEKTRLLSIINNPKIFIRKLKRLLKEILTSTDLHKTFKEEDINKLISILGISKTTASGGQLCIYGMVFHYHSSHGHDRNGTLDGNLLRSLKNTLNELGITAEIFSNTSFKL